MSSDPRRHPRRNSDQILHRQQNRSRRDSLPMEMTHDVWSFASSVKKIAGHVSLAARFCNLCAKNGRHLRMYAHYFFSASLILQKKTELSQFKSENRQSIRGN